MSSRGLTAHPEVSVQCTYYCLSLPKFLPYGQRGKKRSVALGALVLVSIVGKRRYTLLPSSLLGERPLPPTQLPCPRSLSKQSTTAFELCSPGVPTRPRPILRPRLRRARLGSLDPKPLTHAAISLARPIAGLVRVWDLVVPG